MADTSGSEGHSVKRAGLIFPYATLCLGLVLQPQAGEATPIEFKFTGTVTGGLGVGGGGPFPNGSTVSGWYFFESETAEAPPGSGNYGGAIRSFTLNIGSNVYSTTNPTSSYITVKHPSGFDDYRAEAAGAGLGPPVEGFNATRLQVFVQTDPDFFSGTALPLTPPPLQKNHPQLFYIRWEKGPGQFNQTEGTLKSFVVPEPGGLSLVALGLAAAFVGRCSFRPQRIAGRQQSS